METITVTDMDLAQLARSGQCFTWRCLGESAYAVQTADAYVEVRQCGDVFTFSCDKAEFEGIWRAYFDLDTDYGAMKRSIDPQDAYLSAAAAYGGGVRILRQDLWDVMLCFLISQNNNIARIQNSVRGLCERYGRCLQTPDGGTYRALPQPDELIRATAEDFAALGLGYRAKYCAALAAEMQGEGLPSLRRALAEMDDAAALARLMKILGIGRKVAECICLYGLHRINAFPVDTHVRQILDTHYPQGFPFARYEGFLGVMQQYLFYYKLHG